LLEQEKHPQLQVGVEAERITAALSLQHGIEVEHIRNAGQEALRAHLRSYEPHVLHFMGHGGFHEQQGCLMLEDEGRAAAPMVASALSMTLRDLPSLRLVVLNSCRSGQLPRWDGLEPFSGIAAALCMAGAPAVIAMQFPISLGVPG
jgi:CHAT domain-containing protein